MPSYMADGADYTSLYMRLCDCAGAQPSADNARADEHASDCPYRVAVEDADGAHGRGEKDPQ